MIAERLWKAALAAIALALLLSVTACAWLEEPAFPPGTSGPGPIGGYYGGATAIERRAGDGVLVARPTGCGPWGTWAC